MKTFHHIQGNVADSTYTIGELIEELGKYPADMPVMGTWEGVNGYINADPFYLIDVEQY